MKQLEKAGQEGQGRGVDPRAGQLEEQTRAIPVEVCSLEAKVARQSGRLLDLGQFLLQLYIYLPYISCISPWPWPGASSAAVPLFPVFWRSGMMLCSTSSRPFCLATLASSLLTLAGMVLVCSSSPLITSLALPFLASSMLKVRQKVAKKTQVSDFQNSNGLSYP